MHTPNSSPAEIGDTDLSRKIFLCRELLEVAKILEPGQSIFRGKLLVDLQEALFVQTERQISNREISSVVAHVSFSCQTQEITNQQKCSQNCFYFFVVFLGTFQRATNPAERSKVHF